MSSGGSEGVSGMARKKAHTAEEIGVNAMRPVWVNDGLSQGMSCCTFLSRAQWRE